MKISENSWINKIESILDNQYMLFMLVFYMFIFGELVTQFFPFFKFYDEAFAMLAIPLWFWKNRENILCQKGMFVFDGRQLCPWKEKSFWSKELLLESYHFYIFVYLIIGLTSTILFHYQPVGTAIADFIVNIKFWLVLYVGKTMFDSLNFDKHGEQIGKHIKAVVCLYIILILLDYMCGGIFPADIRYGFRSTQLFYGVHTVFSAKCGFLLVLLVLVSEKTKNSRCFLVLLIGLMVSTMRSKAFGAAALFIILYFVIIIKKKKIQLKTLLILAGACLVVGWKQIYYYFFSSIKDGSARNVLLKTSFEIAGDHFPLGSGFGTFACHQSGEVYSPLYKMYGISGTWGLEKHYPAFISDSYWPMVLGQYGYIGLTLFVTVLIILYRKISRLAEIDLQYYLAAMFCLGYMCVSSMAESAFTHPLSIPFAMMLGICLSKLENKQ